MSVIEKGNKNLNEAVMNRDADSELYWLAYIEGARAQKKEGGELAMSAFNYVERQGFMTGIGYAGMTAEERETLLKEFRNMRVGPVATKWGEIVRCGECKHYNAGFECLAEGYGIERDPDWFCAGGEREVQDG